jgi:regulator of replication initiation timing
MTAVQTIKKAIKDKTETLNKYQTELGRINNQAADKSGEIDRLELELEDLRRALIKLEN